MSGTIPLPGPNPLIYPVVMTVAGVLPTPPATLLAQLIQLVTFGTDPTGAQVMNPDPGYTATLPGSLIEDISSTDTGALVLMDQMRVELINSVTPYGANAYILNQLGQMFGVPAGTPANMSVSVVFSGTVNFLVQSGFQVSDGTHTYITQSPVVVGSSGSSLPVVAIAATEGTWVIPADTVTTIITSVPGAITLTVNNPNQGISGSITETEQEYRLRVLQASIATCQGTPPFLKTQLMKVPGVVATQVAVVAGGGGTWKVICGGSNPDPVQVAAAIYLGTPNLGDLVGSTMSIANITQANPGVVTTNLNHGYSNGQVVSFSGIVGMTPLNTGTYTITVISEKSFSIGVNTSGYPAYVSGGVVAPNLRNVTETINDYPDTYVIPYVVPPAQSVQVALTWNTATAFASGPVFNQQAQAAIVNYINSIPVSAPINILAMQEAVQAAVVDLMPLSQLARMVWTIDINGIPTSPTSGTYLVEGDPESYFTTTAADVVVAQG